MFVYSCLVTINSSIVKISNYIKLGMYGLKGRGRGRADHLGSPVAPSVLSLERERERKRERER